MNRTGKQFGRLTIIREGPIHVSAAGNKKWTSICRCQCGKEVIVNNSHLYSGHTQSCGCFHREQTVLACTTHGKSKTRTFKSWADMLQRCTNPNRFDYRFYGLLGITVCNRWKESFADFLADMGECPPGKGIDRWPDNRGNYEPGNCRWATSRQQNRNRRNNKPITVNGVTATLPELCERFNVNYRRVKARINILGWPIERAFYSSKQRNQFG